MKKFELRTKYLERRKLMPPEEHSQLSRDIIARFFNEIDFSSVATIHCYLSLRHFGEIDTSILFEHIWTSFPHVLTTAPKISAAGEVDSMTYQRDTPVVENRWKVREPAASEMIVPEALDIVIVPLLCVDRGGHRVGYGGGYYDRLLKKCRPDCIKAGLSFFAPVESITDLNDADVRLNICFTPYHSYEFTST